MISLFLKRCLQLIPTMIVISIISFMIVHIIPGDPVEIMMGTNVDRQNIEIERERLGLNDPLIEQYFRFVGNAVQGDLGTSIVMKRSVSEEIVRRFQPTIILAIGSTVFAAFFGVVLGVIAAINKDKKNRPVNTYIITTQCFCTIVFLCVDADARILSLRRVVTKLWFWYC